MLLFRPQARGGIENIGDVPHTCLPRETCGLRSLSGVSVFVFQPSITRQMKCDVYIRKDLYANVVLSGGTTMFQLILILTVVAKHASDAESPGVPVLTAITRTMHRLTSNTKQVLTQHGLFRYWKETKTCKTDVYFLP